MGNANDGNSPNTGNEDISLNDLFPEGNEGADSKKPSLNEAEQKFRSGLGRKLKKHEEDMQSIKDGLKSINQLLSERQEATSFRNERVNPNVDDDDKPPFEFVSTPEEVLAVQEWAERKKQKNMNIYAQSYVQSVDKLAYLSPELHPEIKQELLTNYQAYPTYTNHKDSSRDAMVNYRLAEAVILKKKLAAQSGKPNVSGKVGQKTGVTHTSNNQSNADEAEPELDEYATKFLKSVGASKDDQWVKDSLKRKE